MKTRILVTMALVAGMMLAGCSKSEDNMEENNESVKNEQLVSSIRQHIVGTWEHSGSCDSDAPLTPYDDIILRDKLTFENETGDSYEITINEDGKFTISDGNGIYDGLWEVRGTPRIDSEGVSSPFGVMIDHSYYGGRFDRILFSSDYSIMYLHKGVLRRFFRKK